MTCAITRVKCRGVCKTWKVKKAKAIKCLTGIFLPLSVPTGNNTTLSLAKKANSNSERASRPSSSAPPSPISPLFTPHRPPSVVSNSAPTNNNNYKGCAKHRPMYMRSIRRTFHRHQRSTHAQEKLRRKRRSGIRSLMCWEMRYRIMRERTRIWRVVRNT